MTKQTVVARELEPGMWIESPDGGAAAEVLSVRQAYVRWSIPELSGRIHFGTDIRSAEQPIGVLARRTPLGASAEPRPIQHISLLQMRRLTSPDDRFFWSTTIAGLGEHQTLKSGNLPVRTDHATTSIHLELRDTLDVGELGIFPSLQNLALWTPQPAARLTGSLAATPNLTSISVTSGNVELDVSDRERIRYLSTTQGVDTELVNSLPNLRSLALYGGELAFRLPDRIKNLDIRASSIDPDLIPQSVQSLTLGEVRNSSLRFDHLDQLVTFELMRSQTEQLSLPSESSLAAVTLDLIPRLQGAETLRNQPLLRHVLIRGARAMSPTDLQPIVDNPSVEAWIAETSGRRTEIDAMARSAKIRTRSSND